MRHKARFAPEGVAELVIESLEDTERPAYGQVATLGGGKSQVRTVHLRYVRERGTLGFATHVRSAKWSHLKKKPQLSGCHHDAHRLVQFRWEGAVKLVSPDSKRPEDRALLNRMWLLLRPDVRTAYWRDHLERMGRLGEAFDILLRAPTLGVVLCAPKTWDIFKMDASDYTKAERTVYTLKNAHWEPRLVSILHGDIL